MMTTVTDCDICADNIFTMRKRMKLKEFAELNNVSYRTALRHWRQGLIEGVQNGSGAILVSEYKDASLNDAETTTKTLVFIRCPNEKFLEEAEKKLDFFAKELEIEEYDKITWEGYMFQANPHLVDVIEKGYNLIIVERLSDIFGANYKALQFLLELRGVRVESLLEPVAVGSVIYEFYLSAMAMVKAAVGMNTHKKRVFDSASNLFS